MDLEVIEGRLKESSLAGRAALVPAILIAVLTLTYFLLDRPLAAALHDYTRGVPIFVWLTYIASPLAPLASILAAFIGGRAFVRGFPTETESPFFERAAPF